MMQPRPMSPRLRARCIPACPNRPCALSGLVFHLAPNPNLEESFNFKAIMKVSVKLTKKLVQVGIIRWKFHEPGRRKHYNCFLQVYTYRRAPRLAVVDVLAGARVRATFLAEPTATIAWFQDLPEQTATVGRTGQARRRAGDVLPSTDRAGSRGTWEYGCPAKQVACVYI
jgi:hypothetical protein